MRIIHLYNNIVTNISIGKTLPLGCIEQTNKHYNANIGDIYDPQTDTFTSSTKSLEEILELRKAEYPPLVDLADALYWQSKGDSSKMEAYLAACEAVKTKYPKR